MGVQLQNEYQNGAYWATPVGWVCEALARVDEVAAKELAMDYVAHLQAEDFRHGPQFGSPWECAHPAEHHRRNPVYLTSVTCPLASFHRLGW